MKFMWKAEGSTLRQAQGGEQKAENTSAVFPAHCVRPVTLSPCHADPGELFDYTKIGLTKDRPTAQPVQ
jgi:hypothetical protein